MSIISTVANYGGRQPSNNQNIIFILAVLVLVIILGYFVFKLFNKFSVVSSDIGIMKAALIKLDQESNYHVQNLDSDGLEKIDDDDDDSKLPEHQIKDNNLSDIEEVEEIENV